MNEWVQVPIGSLLKAQFAGEWGADVSESGELVRVFRGADFVASGKIERNGGVHRRVASAKLKKIELRSGDLLLEKSGGSPDQPVGRVSYFEGAEGRAVASNFLQTLRPVDAVNSKFLFYLLQNEYALGRVLPFQQQTTGIINFRLSDYLHENVKVPKSSEVQSRIAGLLSALDSEIEINQARLLKLQALRVGAISNTLLPAATASQTLELGTLCEVVTSGSRGWAAFYSETGALFLRIGNLTREHPNLRLDDVVRVQVPAGGEGARTKLQTGDLLISITADLGIVGSVPPGLGEAYVNQHIALARLSNPEADPRWVAHVLASSYGSGQIGRLNDGGAKAGLNLPTIRALRIPLPPRETQWKIVELLDSIDAQLVAEKAHLEKLQLQKRGLMNNLLAPNI